MCYLCLRDNPFYAVDDASSMQYKRSRALEIKRLLKDADEHSLCYIGDATVERLKQEQYRISKDL